MLRRVSLVLLGSLFLFVSMQPALAGGTREKCAAAKAKAAAKRYAAKSNCHSKALAKDEPVSTECLTKAETKFSQAFVKIEGKGGCATVGDVDIIEQKVDACLLDIIAAVTPSDCGNGTCDSSEDCATCAADCGVCPVVCGDGLITGDEGCDDGDILDGDGCSSACTVEDGWECGGEPSVCQPIVPF